MCVNRGIVPGASECAFPVARHGIFIVPVGSGRQVLAVYVLTYLYRELRKGEFLNGGRRVCAMYEVQSEVSLLEL